MTNSLSQRLQVVQANLAEAEQELGRLNRDLGEVNRRLEDLSGERQRYDLLEDICTSLDKLAELGAANLFWGEENAGSAQEQQLQLVRDNVAQFQGQIGEIDADKQRLLTQIDQQVLSLIHI